MQRPEINVNCHSSGAIHLVFKMGGSLTSSLIRIVWRSVSKSSGSPPASPAPALVISTLDLSHEFWSLNLGPPYLRSRTPLPDLGLQPYYFFIIWKTQSASSASFFLLSGWPWLHVQHHRLHWESTLSKPHKPRHGTCLLWHPHIVLLAFVLTEDTQKSSHHSYMPQGAAGVLCLLGRPGGPWLFVYLSLLQTHTLSISGRSVLSSYLKNRLHI